MIHHKKAIIVLIELLTILLFVPKQVFAFKPAAHIVIMEQVKNQLPVSSIIRQSMESYPKIAAAGANGPDINYGNLRVALGFSPWSDRYHFHLVGTYAATQLKDAIASNDRKKIAWAAGWITHVAGDLYGHGIFVNPEAGVALDNPAGKDAHTNLEKLAEPVVWISIGGHSMDSYNNSTLPGFLCDASELPASFVDQVSNEVYGTCPNAGDFQSWYENLVSGIKYDFTGLAYSYPDYQTALTELAINNRDSHLRDAVRQAVEFSKKLLIPAEQGNYSFFSNEWNLDAGFNGRTIGSLTVQIKTSGDWLSGTDADIYFGVQFASGKTKEWLCDKAGYNDFEQGDDNQYYFYLGDSNFTLGEIQRVYIRMGKRYFIGDDWKCDRIIVWINGHRSEYRVSKTFTYNGDKWQFQYRLIR